MGARQADRFLGGDLDQPGCELVNIFDSVIEADNDDDIVGGCGQAEITFFRLALRDFSVFLRRDLLDESLKEEGLIDVICD